MKSITDIRSITPSVVVLGTHPAIIQSMLDFDVVAGRSTPSVIAIVAAARSAQKFFFGASEVIIPCYANLESVPVSVRTAANWMLNVQSGRRVLQSTKEFFSLVPHAFGGHIFTENVPEHHTTELIERFGKDYIIAGPSGVGLLVSGHLKLGAIGGTDAPQIIASHIATGGSVAVVSTSGGMTNELIRSVAHTGNRVSFSVCIGGDRFPITSLRDVLVLAENDPDTAAIAYFGELGGTDEYDIVEMLQSKTLTKPIICYVAGVIDEAFDEHMQFGHAKALVAHEDESAGAKRAALREAGATAADTFTAFLDALSALPKQKVNDREIDSDMFLTRRSSILSTRRIVSLDEACEPLQNGTLAAPQPYAHSRSVLRALLGVPVTDPTAAFVEAVFSLLIDHGGHVSGAVTTMVTARAGKDMVSSLAAGLLSIGPRFGGAVNEAARAWRTGVSQGTTASEFVEAMNRKGTLLSGIGHRKYRVGLPDPRVSALSSYADLLVNKKHYTFAREVESITTGKSGNLILNVDGVIAAVLLDLLMEKEGMTDDAIDALMKAEFFNALFIIPRSVGFIAHFMEQKKHDEGLFRLPDDLLYEHD